MKKLYKLILKCEVAIDSDTVVEKLHTVFFMWIRLQIFFLYTSVSPIVSCASGLPTVTLYIAVVVSIMNSVGSAKYD